MVIFDKLPEAPDKSRLIKNGCPWGKKPTIHRGQNACCRRFTPPGIFCPINKNDFIEK